MDEPTRKRFWAKVDKTDTCWNWTAATRSGYGAFQSDGKIQSAHRLSYTMAHGPIYDCVLHKCNNKLCVNPDHLYDGSHKDNARDAIVAGTFHYCLPSEEHVFKPGEKHPSAKLSQEDVRHIRLLHRSGLGYRKIGQIYGVDNTNIRWIIKGKTWSHVS